MKIGSDLMYRYSRFAVIKYHHFRGRDEFFSLTFVTIGQNDPKTKTNTSKSNFLLQYDLKGSLKGLFKTK